MLENLLKLEENWVVFFDLFSRNGNGDSIRPIAEELRKRRPDLKFFFCDKKRHRKKHIDMADEIITEKTLKFKYVCSKAKYIISPMGFPNGGKKREGQVFIQTWHGCPIKKIYLSRNNQNKKFNKYIKQFEQTDYFCTQADIHSENLAEALNLPMNKFINTGLPRNDILFNATDEFKQNLKKELGLPKDKKVILYCPTWRRYDYKAQLPFDLEKIKKELGNEYVLLLRSHVGKHTWVDKHNKPIEIFDNEFCFNGGDYPECTHLFLISDLMITDYSSLVFDFAITKKPQILYIYDYEDYKKEFDLYFDYKDFSPFPKPTDEDQLIETIKNYPEIHDAYEDFVKKYVLYDKGDATRQVIDKFLNNTTI